MFRIILQTGDFKIFFI